MIGHANACGITVIAESIAESTVTASVIAENIAKRETDIDIYCSNGYIL